MDRPRRKVGGFSGKGKVVRVDKGRFKGCHGVILYETPKYYSLKLLRKTRPLEDRFSYHKGKITSAKSKVYFPYVWKANVTMTNKTANKATNSWQKETSAWLGKTRADVSKAIRKRDKAKRSRRKIKKFKKRENLSSR